MYPNVWAFIRFLFVMLLVAFSSSAFGHFISVLFTSPETAVAVSPVIILPLMILGGFMANSGTVPSWIGWLQYVSPIRYSFEASLQNEFSFRPNVPQMFNPNYMLGFTLGYAATMFLMLAVALTLRVLCTIILKLRVSKF